MEGGQDAGHNLVRIELEEVHLTGVRGNVYLFLNKNQV
jgi:hypothetical protein